MTSLQKLRHFLKTLLRITMVTSSNRTNFLKILANLLAKFGVPMTFGLAVT